MFKIRKWGEREQLWLKIAPCLFKILRWQDFKALIFLQLTGYVATPTIKSHLKCDLVKGVASSGGYSRCLALVTQPLKDTYTENTYKVLQIQDIPGT